MKALDLKNKTFGYLTVIEKTDNRKSGQVMWLCECICGTKKEVRARSLANGYTISCGCKLGKDLITHGEYKSPIYKKYRAMIDRCSNSVYYKDISVCKEWIEDYYSFKKWALNNGFEKDLVIDRKNTYGNYEPDNCRWITQKENTQNKCIQSNNTSGYIGVSKIKEDKYRVYYTFNGTRKQIGVTKSALSGSIMRERFFANNKIGLRNGI